MWSGIDDASLSAGADNTTHLICCTNGVMGSLSADTSAAMRTSRIIKLVAQVSSSISRQLAPTSSNSCTEAAWLVLPLASSELKQEVSLRVTGVAAETSRRARGVAVIVAQHSRLLCA
jgi:hypothetical protein